MDLPATSMTSQTHPESGLTNRPNDHFQLIHKHLFVTQNFNQDSKDNIFNDD